MALKIKAAIQKKSNSHHSSSSVSQPITATFSSSNNLSNSLNTGLSLVQNKNVNQSSVTSIQPKLNAKYSQDHYERQADNFADKIVSGHASQSPFFHSIDPLQSGSKQKKEKISESNNPEEIDTERQEKSDDRDTIQLDNNIQEQIPLLGQGQPLNQTLRAKMEQGFGADFSGVRIHTDSAAVIYTQILKAQALTQGRHIYFNQDRYRPNTHDGQHLLSHELTHTIQQRASGPDNQQLFIDDKEKETLQKPLESKEESQFDTLNPQLKELDSNYLIRPELLKAIALARSQIGTVNTKVTNEAGERIGWERLYDFFFTAFGQKEVIHKSIIQFIKKVSKDGKQVDILPSWCGIFVWWSLKKAGVPMPDWKLGVPILKHTRQRSAGELPRKGDIAYRASHQHFAMVTGVEDPSTAAGKDFKSIKVFTVNGNTSGEDNLGGQIQEMSHPIGKWLGFFDPVANANMPDVPLVETNSIPDPLIESTEKKLTDSDKSEVGDSTTDNVISEEERKDTPIIPEAGVSGENSDVPLVFDEPAPVELEKGAEVKVMQFEGTSDQAIIGITETSPSVMAASFSGMGSAVNQKMEGEKKKEIADAPVLKAQTKGTVDEGMVPPDQLVLPTGTISDGITGPNPSELVASPTKNLSEPPSNKKNDALIEKESKSEGFLAWLKNNITNFMRGIKTTDNGINTSAGTRQKVNLQGDADPNRVSSQGKEAQTQVIGQRDIVTDELKNHPGQKNIKPKKVEETKKIVLSSEPAPEIKTESSESLNEYVQAPLPESVRKKADELLQPKLEANLSDTKNKTQATVTKRDNDKTVTISQAEIENKKLTEKADLDQKNTVIVNRKKVAEQQKQGINEAYSAVDDFNAESNKKQKDAVKSIKDEVKSKEDAAVNELEKGEKKAEEKKIAAEKEAAEKKQKLKKEQKNSSWWDKTKGFIKSAVKAITSAIDKVFTAVRSVVKGIIKFAKDAAIGLINAARKFAVNAINKFRNWAKDQVNKYLSGTFPGLAKRINAGIDAVADGAVATVNFIADTYIAAVSFVADTLSAGLDKILSIAQTALKATVQVFGAVLTGDFVGALKIAIQAGCDIAGIDSQPIFDFFDRAGKQVLDILKHPGKFFNNLVSAVGGGVRSFKKNIKEHLINGVIGWLTGALSAVKIVLPKKFDGKGFFSLAMQILGLTYDNIKTKIIKKFPPAEKVFYVVEKGIEIIHKMATHGISALWDEVVKSLSNLKEMVLGAIKSFVITTVVKEAITWVLGLLNPAGALVKILKLLFDFVMFLVNRFIQIKDFVLSVYSSITAIVSGNLSAAMKAVEAALAKSLPVVISLLASLAGLGGIGKTVQNIIGKVTKPINKIVDSLINRAVKFVRKFLKKGKKVAKKVAGRFLGWLKIRKKFTATNGANHEIFFKGTGDNASLMIASSYPGPFSRFLTTVKETDLDDKGKTYLSKAKKIATKIEKLKRVKVKGATEAAKKAAAKKKKEGISEQVRKLTIQTRFLFGKKKDLPVWKAPTFRGLTTAGFGKSMRIFEMSKNGLKKGTKPNHNAHKVYDTINFRRNSPGGASFYIRGHLLNDNLGGKGDWENMTPLSRSGNSQHEQNAESFVKAGVKSGAVFNYYVIPKYPGSRKSKGLKSDVASLHPADATKFNDIIDAENHVPLSLTCIAQRLVKKEDAFKVDKENKWHIQNAIKRNANDYHLSAHQKIVPVHINTTKNEFALKNLAIKHNNVKLEKKADAIMKAVFQKRPIRTYDALAKEVGSLSGNDLRKFRDANFIRL